MFTIHRCYVPAKVQFFYTFRVLFSEFLPTIFHFLRRKRYFQYLFCLKFQR